MLKMFASSENEKLFCKPVPVSVKDVYTKQSRNTQLFFTMEWQDASSGMFSKKVLVLSLTDNNDPFFLYHLHLSEEDFQMLKTSQALLINFASFPQHIIDYIEKCLLDEKNPQPKFLLLFTVHDKNISTNGNMTTSSQLEIIETNQFKHLIHLSLKFIAATDSAVRTYLASCFRSLKEENRQLLNNLTLSEQNSKEKLASYQHTLNGKSQELELLRMHHSEELHMIESKHSVELQEERSRLLSKIREQEDRCEREKREEVTNLRQQIQQRDSRMLCLETLNKELQEKNFQHESTIRELRSNLLSSENEIKLRENEIRKLKESLQSYKKKCETLNHGLKEKQSVNNQKDETINSLQQELRNKGYNITRLKEQVDAIEKQRKTLQAQFENIKLQLEMSENSLKVVEDEKCDLYEKIRKLQDKIKAGHEQARSKSDISSKQEQELKEKEECLHKLQADIGELNVCLCSKETEIKSLIDSVNCLNKKLETLEKELRVKENTIKYLSRELTEKCIFPQYTPPANLRPSPSNITLKQQNPINYEGQRFTNPENSPVLPISTEASKNARKTTPSSMKNSSCSPLQKSSQTDSAYYTDLTQSTPINPMKKNGAFDPEQFDVDPSALSAAFGSGNKILKHSTAKKEPLTKPKKTITPKTSRVSKTR